MQSLEEAFDLSKVRHQYSEELIRKTDKFGTLGSILFLLSVPYLIFVDLNFEFTIEQSFSWRAIAIVPAIAFLILRATPLKNNLNWMRGGFAVFLSGMMAMALIFVESVPHYTPMSVTFLYSLLFIIFLNFIFASSQFLILCWSYGVPTALYGIFNLVNQYDPDGIIFIRMPLFGAVALLAYTYFQERLRWQEFVFQKKALFEAKRSYQLEHLHVLKDEMLAKTTHELKTPLNGIIGLAEALMDGATEPLSEATHANLSVIASNGKRLSMLVDDILDATQMKTQGLELQRSAIALHTFVGATFELLDSFRLEKDLTFVNEVPEDFPAIWADENRFQQILLNLVGNAIKFTSSGSIRISALDEKIKAVIVVEDSGIGISQEQIGKIFSAPDQVKSKIGHKFGGAGLGLNITRQLVELHEGKIHVESELGVGSRFIVTLPLAKQNKIPDSTPALEVPDTEEKKVIPEEPTESPAQVERHNFNILLVDDEPSNLMVLENHLRLEGYSIRKAIDGKSGLRSVEESVPDLILLDVMLPDVNGFEVCKHIRRRHQPSELPIIFLTAKGQLQDLVEGFNAGGNDYVPKPFSKSELLARISTQLQLLLANQRLVALREFTSEIGDYRVEDEIAASVYNHLMADRLTSEVALFDGEKLVISSKENPSTPPTTLKDLEAFCTKDKNSQIFWATFLEHYHVMARMPFSSSVEWVRSLIYQVQLNRETIQKLSYDPVLTPELSKMIVLLDQFLFIKAERNYCLIHTDDRVEEIRISLKNIILRLPKDRVLPVHRSYCVNPKRVNRLSKNDKGAWGFQSGSHWVPIGKTFLPHLKKQYPLV